MLIPISLIRLSSAWTSTTSWTVSSLHVPLQSLHWLTSCEEVGSVGGIVGTSVSASFLFLIACINTFFLIQAIRHRRQVLARSRAAASTQGEDDQQGSADVPEDDAYRIQGGGCMVRIIMPILKAVDRPWKMYPVGILFGFGTSSSSFHVLCTISFMRADETAAGFDTASSIALLAISAVAQHGADGKTISHGKIVILPVSPEISHRRTQRCSGVLRSRHSSCLQRA